MKKNGTFEAKDLAKPFNTLLEVTLREGARKLLQEAIEIVRLKEGGEGKYIESTFATVRLSCHFSIQEFAS